MERMSLEHEGKVALLRFNLPEVINAIGGQMLRDFVEAIEEVKARGTETRCLMITGSGRAFCAGANLQDDDSGKKSKEAGASLRNSYHPLMFEIRDLGMPVVTAVNGAAAGVGMSFAMIGDIVCASKQAYFLQAFARIGLIPDGGATYLLPRLVGWGRAMELSMLAEKLPAETAHDQDSLDAGSLEIATKLANGPKSLSLIRKAYWQTWGNGYEQQLELEAQLQNEAGRTQDFREGVSAFLEKRDAKFGGQ